ncbi:MAG: YihY/virulence factor BrkB family protein [Defluviitaleaceae bacterium]|nr:YihY/virulence factor BrkB family protein [Defluviitaleaceae bacterium]MCL2239747.1 YihY/virulence factor BrkB family protein [Defluviitaleaceae bacterium]
MAIAIFIINLIQKCRNDDIMARSAELTYRVLLAFFPFLVFLMALVGFLQLEESVVLQDFYAVLPEDVAELVRNFLSELSLAQSRGLLSTGLFFAVYNTTNGFRAVIRCINRAFGVEDPRGLVKRVLLSLALMLLFTLSILFMAGALIFGAEIWAFFLPNAPGFLFNAARVVGSLTLLTFTTMLIYKFSCAVKLKLRHVLPGAALTVTLWSVASALFGIFMANFSQFPAVYGSIAGVFILILWLNLISIILLVGNEFNALLYPSPPWKQFTS